MKVVHAGTGVFVEGNSWAIAFFDVFATVRVGSGFSCYEIILGRTQAIFISRLYGARYQLGPARLPDHFTKEKEDLSFTLLPLSL